MQSCGRERGRAGIFGVGRVYETLACEFGMEGIDAVVNRGVQLECHLDEGRPLAVSLHGADIATGWPNSSSIEVPERRLAGGASAADFLSHALLHLTPTSSSDGLPPSVCQCRGGAFDA